MTLVRELVIAKLFAKSGGERPPHLHCFPDRGAAGPGPVCLEGPRVCGFVTLCEDFTTGVQVTVRARLLRLRRVKQEGLGQQRPQEPGRAALAPWEARDSGALETGSGAQPRPTAAAR